MSLNSDAVRGLAFGLALEVRDLLREHLGDVRPVAPGLGDDVATGLRVLAEHPAVVGRGLEQLARLLRGHLVRGDVVVDGRAAGLTGRALGQLAARGVHAGRHGLLDVRAVAADAHDDVVADRDGGDLAGVDLAEVGDEVTQPLAGLGLVAEVEALQPARPAPRRRWRSGRGPPPSRR